MKIITICARGGSQGVPGKNIRSLLGKPLIAWTIEQAIECPDIDGVYVSTDCEAIAEVARQYGARVPFIRPASMATNDAPKIPVIRHLAEWVHANVGNVEMIVDLDPTSPLREVSDITDCMNMLNTPTDVVITAYESDKNPYFNMVEINEDGYAKLSKPPISEVFGRQSAPKVYSMNGSVYVWHRTTIEKGLWGGCTAVHVMPRERSIDIDSSIDFKLVELLMREKIEASLI
jgi:CMP-N,N'-diacetyllegionaminic acid synthase